MPRGDRTGPAGMGPMTGRAMGYCAGFDRPGYANPGPGFVGRGFGGGGHGRRHWHHATGLPGWMRAGWGANAPYAPPYPQTGLSKDQEMDMLKAQSEGLRSALDEIAKRLSELESSEDKK